MELALGEAHDCEVLGTVVPSGVPGMGDGEGEWLVWAMSLAVPTCDGCCGEGGIPFREAKSILCGLKGIPPTSCQNIWGHGCWPPRGDAYRKLP